MKTTAQCYRAIPFRIALFVLQPVPPGNVVLLINGSTPLHCATWKGHQEIVAFLLDAGADVNAQNRNEHWGTTPLHAAAHANQAAIAQLLIEHGADINAQDLNGKTPMHHTTFHRAKAVAKLLQKYEAV